MVEALAIRDGRIVATGTSAAMRKLAGPGTRTIDVQGRTVIPGLIDSHLHAIRAARAINEELAVQFGTTAGLSVGVGIATGEFVTGSVNLDDERSLV